MLRPHFVGSVTISRVLGAPAVACLQAVYARISPNFEQCGAARLRERTRLGANSKSSRRQTMQKGTVKWFNPTKGYGFIRPAGGEKDVFVHISAVERAGLSTLNEGQTVEYE